VSAKDFIKLHHTFNNTHTDTQERIKPVPVLRCLNKVEKIMVKIRP